MPDVMTPNPPVSPELALLAACALAGDEQLAAKAEATCGPGFDWGRFASLAAYHSLAALAGSRLAKAAPGVLPDEIAASFHRQLQQQAALELVQTAESASLTRRLAAAGIRSIVLKGMALAHLLYAPDPQLRGSNDLDLLIAEGDLMATDSLLRSDGYERTFPAAELPGCGLDMLLTLANVFDYVSPANGITLELHFRPNLNPHVFPIGFDEIYATTVELDTASGPFRSLDGPLHMAYLCVHAIAHAGYRLKWFADIHRALHQAGAASCADHVASAGLGFARRPAEVADAILATLARSCGTERSARAIAVTEVDVQRVICDMEHLVDRGESRTLARLPSELSELGFLLRIAPSNRARFHHLLVTLTDPRDAYALRLGRRFGVIYALAGPVLSLVRFLKRGRAA